MAAPQRRRRQSQTTPRSMLGLQTGRMHRMLMQAWSGVARLWIQRVQRAAA